MKLTIFTPTFNRGYILPQLYESLKRQNYLNDFEWLIVDDGSDDDTKYIIDKFVNENIIDIKYIYQENQGKMQAHNTGVLNACGQFFICVDSDDYLSDNAVNIIIDNLEAVNLRKDCIGLVAMRGVDDKTPIKGKFMPDVNYENLVGVYNKGYAGDTALVFLTSEIRKFLFPVIPNEKFIPEAYIYDQIDKVYVYKVVNEILIVCAYLQDGYTNNVERLIINNPRGWGLWYNQCLTDGTIKDKMFNAVRYVSVMILAGEKHYIKKSNNKFFTALAILPGSLLAKKRKRGTK